MNRLPPELLELIAFHVEDGCDIRNLRLVSRQLCRCTTPSLFSTVMLYPNSGSFDRLEAMLAQSPYGVLVKHLIYSADMFRYYERWVDEFKVWKDQAMGTGLPLAPGSGPLANRIITRKNIRDGWKAWKESVAMQGAITQGTTSWDANGEISKRSVEFSRLEGCLFRMPNLQSVEWGWTDSERDPSSHRKSWKRSTRRQRLEAEVMLGLDGYGGKVRHGKQVTALLGALSLVKSAVSTLKYLSELDLDGIKLSHFHRIFNPSERHRYEVALADVTSLRIHLHDPMDGSEDRLWGYTDKAASGRAVMADLQAMFSCTAKLEKLDLDFAPVHWTSETLGSIATTLKHFLSVRTRGNLGFWRHLATRFQLLEQVELDRPVLAFGSQGVAATATLQVHGWFGLLRRLQSMLCTKRVHVKNGLYAAVEKPSDPSFTPDEACDPIVPDPTRDIPGTALWSCQIVPPNQASPFGHWYGFAQVARADGWRHSCTDADMTFSRVE